MINTSATPETSISDNGFESSSVVRRSGWVVADPVSAWALPTDAARARCCGPQPSCSARPARAGRVLLQTSKESAGAQHVFDRKPLQAGESVALGAGPVDV